MFHATLHMATNSACYTLQEKLQRPELWNDVALDYNRAWPFNKRLGFHVAIDAAARLPRSLPVAAVFSLSPPGHAHPLHIFCPPSVKDSCKGDCQIRSRPHTSPCACCLNNTDLHSSLPPLPTRVTGIHLIACMPPAQYHDYREVDVRAPSVQYEVQKRQRQF